MVSGEQSVEKVLWMPMCLPLSANSWDTQRDLEKQLGKWFGQLVTRIIYMTLIMVLMYSYAQAVPVWLTSVSCPSSSSCLSSCLASAPTATQTCSSNTYLKISCSELNENVHSQFHLDLYLHITLLDPDNLIKHNHRLLL